MISEDLTIDEYTITGTQFEYRARVVQDTEPAMNPREDYSNAGRIVARSRNFRVLTPQEDGPDRYSRANADSIIDAIQDHPFRVVDRWLRIFHGATVVLPLRSGHDGLTVETCSPEALRANKYDGITFDTPRTRKDTIGKGLIPADQEIPTMRAALVADIDTYTAWSRGEVYGWVVERRPLDDEDGEWEDLDSVWGYIGETEYPMSEAVSTAESYLADDDRAAIEDEKEIRDLQRAELGMIVS